jgi:hypothetical protein
MRKPLSRKQKQQRNRRAAGIMVIIPILVFALLFISPKRTTPTPGDMSKQQVSDIIYTLDRCLSDFNLGGEDSYREIGDALRKEELREFLASRYGEQYFQSEMPIELFWYANEAAFGAIFFDGITGQDSIGKMIDSSGTAHDMWIPVNSGISIGLDVDVSEYPTICIPLMKELGTFAIVDGLDMNQLAGHTVHDYYLNSNINFEGSIPEKVGKGNASPGEAFAFVNNPVLGSAVLYSAERGMFKPGMEIFDSLGYYPALPLICSGKIQLPEGAAGLATTCASLIAEGYLATDGSYGGNYAHNQRFARMFYVLLENNWLVGADFR